MTVAIKGYLGNISVNDGSGAAQTEWSEVYEIVVPDPRQPRLDVTHLQSPNETREYIAGYKDTSDITFSQNYVASDYARAKGLQGTMKTWRVEFPDGEGVTFLGFLAGSAMTVGLDTLRVTHTVTVSGAVTLI